MIRSLTGVIFSALLLGACSEKQVRTTDNFEVVELPDGSVAYLNYNSSIVYNSDLRARNVEVEGEVFFDVRESDIPFIVITDHGEVTVLGTAFNVKSDKEQMEVEVEEGVVELKTTSDIQKIDRGERGKWKKGSKVIKKSKGELNFHIWLKSLKKEFKTLGKEIKRGAKEVRKETKKVGKKVNQGLKSLKK